MNHEFSKDSHFDLAPVIVPALRDAFSRGMGAQVGKSADEHLPIGSARCLKEVKCLLIEDKLPLGHSAPLDKKPPMDGEHFLFGNLATGIHPIHRGVDLLPNDGFVEAIEDFQILRKRHPLVAAHRLQFRFNFSKTHGGKMADFAERANGLSSGFTHFAGGSVAIEMGGTAAGQLGRITINGSAHSTPLRVAAALPGTLNLSAVNGFDPGIGSTFNVLTYTSHTGQFDTVNPFDAAQGARSSIGKGKQFAVTYGASGLTVNTVAPSTPANSLLKYLRAAS